MGATTDQLQRLRRMVAEPNAENGYTDNVLRKMLEGYPLPDDSGKLPTDQGWDSTSLDLHAAAGDIWTEKAAAVAADFAFSADGASYSRQQVYEQYNKQARFHNARRAARSERVEVSPKPCSNGWIGKLPEGNYCEVPK